MTDAEWESEPLAPVTTTFNVTAVGKLQDRTALPEPDMIAGEKAHAVLFVIKLTTPANPIIPVTVTFEVAVAPTLAARLVGLTTKVKSWTLNVTWTRRDREALVPVTPTWNVPTDVKRHERVELPEPVILVGERVHPVLLVARLTPPEKPFKLVTLIVDVPAEP